MDKSTFVEKYMTPIAVLLGAVIIAFALAYGHGAVTGTTGGAAGQPTAADVSKINTKNEPFIGDASAPVTMAVYFDYQCPFCKQFDQMALPQLVDQYVKTGKVKVYFKDFQFLGQDSITGSEFGRAIWALYPDSYYPWLTAMFSAQDDEGDQGFGDQDSIVAMTKAQVPAIDTDKVVAYVNANKAAIDAAVSADRDEGAAMGINGTPSIIVGKKLFYALTPDQFASQISAEIDAELK
ncbi:MAG TPA: thioredoxin domain-containing protein [Candidatus Paceibacterota bacterium]